jgi:hypothetical protein
MATPADPIGIIHVHRGHPSQSGTGLGWTVYAALMLFASAVLNIAWGVLSIADDAYWGGDTLVSGHTVLFGWIWIGMALFELAVIGLVLTANPLGMVLGIAIAIANIAGHVSALADHAAWGVLAIGADLLLVYALLKPWLIDRADRRHYAARMRP